MDCTYRTYKKHVLPALIHIYVCFFNAYGIFFL